MIIAIIEISHYYGDECGIPVHLWLDIYFLIYLFGALIDLNGIWIVKKKPYWLYDFMISRNLIILLILSTWIIFGYLLYFSDSNDC